ncbi:hypothetical protein N657DRAFT_678134 [Parathielavia appendiculata]|uniref:Uncharacterized protein n=1 Tax=Parathielavia appendiculata TaxID=2587402 RepID=A0AAN6U6Y9_9PEZI|nr:hypothetical protein N657DRAFT_678134 [Parathielavia appendiculata]
MAIQPTSANTSIKSLSQKLRDLGRFKHKNEEKLEEEFEIVHTPDRPSRHISPIEAPTEEECGDEIARWQRASLKARRSMFTRGQYGRADMQDGSAVNTESDDDADEHARHHLASDLALGREVGRGGCGQQPALHHHRPLKPVTPRQTGQTEVARQEVPQQAQATAIGAQHGSDRAKCAKFPAAPAPLFSGTPRSAPTSHPRSVSPALATVVGDSSLARARYTGGKHLYTDEEDVESPVDVEKLARIDIYRRGSCPFCRKFFGNNPLPLFCPYPDCKRDLRKCLEYPNRREVEKAPPRLRQRTYSYAQPGADVRTMDQGMSTRQPVPSLTVEAPTPIEDQLSTRLGAPPSPPSASVSARRQRSPSPYRELRTICPTPSGFYDLGQPIQPSTLERQKYIDKPLPPPPIPPARSERRPPPPPPPHLSLPHLSPPTSLYESISARHQQLYRPSQQQQQQYITSQMKATPPTPNTSSQSHSSTPPASPSPCSSNATSSSSSTRTDNTPSGASSSRAVGDLISTSKHHNREQQQHGKSSSTATAAMSTCGTAHHSHSTSSSSDDRNGGSRLTTRRSTRSRSSYTTVDDREFLAWKTPREVAQFERERRDKGDDAELFMDIIGEYGDGDYRGRELGRKGFI